MKADASNSNYYPFKSADKLSEDELPDKNPKTTTENRKREVEKNKSNKSIGGNNESYKFRQLSSHNDSFEYTVMNLQKRSNTRNWRLFLIRHVLLP